MPERTVNSVVLVLWRHLKHSQLTANCPMVHQHLREFYLSAISSARSTTWNIFPDILTLTPCFFKPRSLSKSLSSFCCLSVCRRSLLNSYHALGGLFQPSRPWPYVWFDGRLTEVDWFCLWLIQIVECCVGRIYQYVGYCQKLGTVVAGIQMACSNQQDSKNKND